MIELIMGAVVAILTLALAVLIPLIHARIAEYARKTDQSWRAYKKAWEKAAGTESPVEKAYSPAEAEQLEAQYFLKHSADSALFLEKNGVNAAKCSFDASVSAYTRAISRFPGRIVASAANAPLRSGFAQKNSR